MHAQDILADAGQALAEWRVNQRAHESEADQQDAERIKILRIGEQRIEFEPTKHRCDGKIQAVETTRQAARHVGALFQQRHDAERQHQQRESLGAQQDKARSEADYARRQAAHSKPTIGSVQMP